MDKNLLQVFLKTVDRLGEASCFRFKQDGKWETLSWREVRRRVQAVGEGFQSLGIKKGETVVLFASTRVEWTLCDLGILSIGGISVPIYHSSTADQAAYIIRDAEAKLVVVENEETLKRVREKNRDIPVVVMEGRNGSDAISLDELMRRGKGGESWQAGIDAIPPEQVATYVYTSGTTGDPKGVILTHRNFLAEIDALHEAFDFLTERHETVIFLPLAHIVSRALQFFQFKVGLAAAYAEGIDKLAANLAEIRPHFFVAVPRIFEKVYEKIHAQVEAGSSLKKGIFAWAVAVGREVSVRKQEGRPLPVWLRFQYRLATRLVFCKLKARLGGRILFAISGGAPLARSLGEFFDAAGILILEGYGLTETAAAVNCNRLDRYQFGSVGPAVRGADIRIAADGEILVRGPMVFQGYFKKPEATREALTPDGWFHTGDVGEIDRDGFLRITDRKKDIIVTAGGKNVAPQNIENLMKSVPYISQVMVHGDRRKFLSALVTLNREPVEDYARQRGISFGDFRELARHPEVYRLVKSAIEEQNKKLASFETIKKFAILENDFTQEAGELTPTLKVKRKFVSEKYKDVLSKFYEECLK